MQSKTISKGLLFEPSTQSVPIANTVKKIKNLLLVRFQSLHRDFDCTPHNYQQNAIKSCLAFTRKLRKMRLPATILLGVCLLTIQGFSQEKITLFEKDATLQKVFDDIQKQTIYNIWYDKTILPKTSNVNIEVKDGTLEQALDLSCKNQPLEYNIVGKMVVIKEKDVKKKNDSSLFIDIHGKVVDENGAPIEGVSISIRHTKIATSTDESGGFIILSVGIGSILEFTGTNIQTFEVVVNGKKDLLIKLKKKISGLDEIQIIGYGTTTRRLSTGSVTTVTAKEIEEQPVSNPIAALEGRVPGLVVTESKGLPGASFKIQVRGQNSISQGSNPLLIVDGVPFAGNNNNLNGLYSALSDGNGAGISPLNSINPYDIESIDVLKDADALAIYGSRGANGVILITTKKGKAGKTHFTFSGYNGISEITKGPDLLNTQQYVAVRREALNNDGLPIDIYNAPDLVAWDTTRYTDFKKLLYGGTAHMTNLQASISGGNSENQFLIGGGLLQQSTVFPGDLSYYRGSFHSNISHTSIDKKFSIYLSTIYSADKNNIISTDLSGVGLLPNTPALYDSSGKLNWEEKGVRFSNPLAFLLQKYIATTENLIGNLHVSYTLSKGLNFKLDLGYNTLQFREISLLPISSQDPLYASTGASDFGENMFKNWIIEPQVEYSTKISKGNLNILIGGTWQEQTNTNSSISATGFTSDALLQSLSATDPSNLILSSYSSLYHYEALFGRFNYNWQNRYIINLSGRRDGSSRFGPGNQFGNFGAIGGSWIFSNEKFLKYSSVFSFGKFRVSYGTTGNDQIGDYNYLDRWTSTPYDETSGLYPVQLYNSNYAWEVNKKFETAMDLGFLKDRILFSIAYFRNRSSNQLVNYQVSSQTGFSSVLANFPAVVQNSGFEVSLNTKNISSRYFNWLSSFALTVPHNILVSFPGLSNSGYASLLVVGKSLTTLKGYHYTGVDPSTGLFSFEDVNKDQKISYPDDYVTYGNQDPQYYGSLSSVFSFKGWKLSLFFEGRKQKGINYLYSIYNTFPPGTMANFPVEILDRWQKPGDIKEVQKYTSAYGSPAYNQISNFVSSDARLTDASFIRLKTMSLSYHWPLAWLNKMNITDLDIFLQGENLFVITSYKDGDPESQNILGIPPLRTLTIGIQLTL